MQWYYIMLIVLLVIGGLLAAGAVALHIFECTYIYRRNKKGIYGISDASFNITDSGTGQSSGNSCSSPQEVQLGPFLTSKPEGKGPESPNSMLTWSSMSSPNATSAGFPSPTMPMSPDPAYGAGKKSRTHFISLDGLRGGSNRTVRERDVEAQDTNIERDFAKIGW